jgi:hypothetical protein
VEEDVAAVPGLDFPDLALALDFPPQLQRLLPLLLLMQDEEGLRMAG